MLPDRKHKVWAIVIYISCIAIWQRAGSIGQPLKQVLHGVRSVWQFNSQSLISFQLTWKETIFTFKCGSEMLRVFIAYFVCSFADVQVFVFD